jgi:endopeptidase La
MKCSELIKRRAREKLKEAKGTREGSEKATKYLDGLLQIPFGNYRKEKILRFMSEFCDTILEEHGQHSLKTESEIDAWLAMPVSVSAGTDATVVADIERLGRDWSQFKLDRKQYLTDTRQTLDDSIYGQDQAKRRIESLVAQWINGEMSGVVFGFQGYPGTGKTTLARQGLSRCLKDEHGVPRPFYHISLGGSTGANMLIGHSYTYVGSQWGKLVDCLQEAKVMNPIIYFDELDKVSDSPQGEEIIRILTHLTDPEQNEEITDRYFNLPMDLSRALIIFSYNNRDKVDPVLMDRIYEVSFKQYCRSDKITIAKLHIVPRILRSAGFSADSLVFSQDTLGYIIESYTVEAGVRDMKDKLTEIVREVNLRRIYDVDKYKLPYTITEELVDDILGQRHKINITEIPKVAQVGWVNGLYATSVGTGGITIIQTFDTPSDKKYSLELTGKLGDVMKESVQCAKTIGMRIFNDADRGRIDTEWSSNALHIHFPAAGTPKDGPSAGGAITTALISYFSRMPVRHYIAMTGEIDLYGNICAIGGLQCKIEGAQRAGVKLVLIPRDNEAGYKEFSADYRVRVMAVDNISQIIRVALIGASDTNFRYMHDVCDQTTTAILHAIRCIDSELAGDSNGDSAGEVL